MKRHTRGFTLIEVLVALVVVVFGIGAVLAALTSSANNISDLRVRSVAQWIAMNQVASLRLTSLKAPSTSTTSFDIKGFGKGNWRVQQIVQPYPQLPGVMTITVRVRRTGDSTLNNSSTGLSGGNASPTLGGNQTGTSGAASASAPFNAPQETPATDTADDTSSKTSWMVTVVGFWGSSLAATNGEAPDWVGTAATTSSSGGTSGGTIGNPASSGGGT